MVSRRTPVIGVISDLGTRDPAIGQFKAAIAASESSAQVIDITHEIRPRDLLEAALTLDRVYRDFPIRTIFVVLVEGLLGAPRRPLLAVSTDYYYFAPDNGVLSFIYDHDAVGTVYHVNAEHYVHEVGPLSPHRDLYGTPAGWLAKGIDSSHFGDQIEDYTRTALPKASRPSASELKGMVLHVDRFGTLVTSIHQNDINAVRQEIGPDKPFRAVLGDTSVPVVASAAEGGPDILAVYDSTGYVAVLSMKGEAAKALNAKRGDPVSIVFGS